MLTFAEKVELLLGGRLVPDDVLKPADWPTHGINKQTSISFAQGMFEEHTSVQSPLMEASKGALVGAHSFFHAGGYLRAPVVIGRYCSIGRRVSVGAGRHPIAGLSSHPDLTVKGKGYSDEERTYLGVAKPASRRPTMVGHDVCIGDGAVILAGVSIGDGAVIRENAVITEDVVPYTVVEAGATTVSEASLRFPAEVVSRLQQIAIWELRKEALMQLQIDNVLAFLKAWPAGGLEAHAYGYRTLGFAQA